jgi:hypothetical protein
LEKGVRVKSIKPGYREGCGDVEDSIVQLSATLPCSQQTLVHQDPEQCAAGPHGKHIPIRAAHPGQQARTNTNRRLLTAKFWLAVP